MSTRAVLVRGNCVGNGTENEVNLPSLGSLPPDTQPLHPAHPSLRVAPPSSSPSTAPGTAPVRAASAPTPAAPAPASAPIKQGAERGHVEGTDALGRPLYSGRKAWNRRGGLKGGKAVWAGMSSEERRDELDRRFRRGRYKEEGE